MHRKRFVPPDHPAFAALPVRMVTVAAAGVQVAVHVSGTLSSRRLPVVCVPGYQRNMTDFSAFADYFQRLGGGQMAGGADRPARARTGRRPGKGG